MSLGTNIGKTFLKNPRQRIPCIGHTLHKILNKNTVSSCMSNIKQNSNGHKSKTSGNKSSKQLQLPELPCRISYTSSHCRHVINDPLRHM